MIGLSPLSSGHPRIFQHSLVGPSAPRYRGFSLPTDRSPGFGSAARNWARSSHSLSLRLRHRLNLAAARQLAGSLCKRHAVTLAGSRSPGAHDFRVCFTPLDGVLFTFPSRYSFAIGRQRYSALWDGPHGFGRGFTCPDLLGCPQAPDSASRTGLSPSAAGLSRPLRSLPPMPDGEPSTPADESAGLGSSAFARHYSRNLC